MGLQHGQQQGRIEIQRRVQGRLQAVYHHHRWGGLDHRQEQRQGPQEAPQEGEQVNKSTRTIRIYTTTAVASERMKHPRIDYDSATLWPEHSMILRGVEHPVPSVKGN